MTPVFQLPGFRTLSGLRILILASVLALWWSEAHAMWVQMSDDQLIEESEVIAVGELRAIETMAGADGAAKTVGVLRLSDVLKGAVADGEVYLKVPQPGAPISSSDIVFKTGQAGLWYLHRTDQDGGLVYSADHPQRFVPLDPSDPMIEQLRKRLGN